MKRSLILFTLMMFALMSCEQKPTLQKYFVEKSEEKNFSTVDIAPSFINTDKLKLSNEEKNALHSMHKFNVLMFKSTKDNGNVYDAEKEKIKTTLKEDSYDELMKMNFGKGGMSVNTKGEGEHIEEFVLFMHNKDNGMGVVRVLGDDMTPQNVMTIVGVLQKANVDGSALQPLMDIMKEKKK